MKLLEDLLTYYGLELWLQISAEGEAPPPQPLIPEEEDDDFGELTEEIKNVAEHKILLDILDDLALKSN
jgi:hypothetical protein